jgi:hypothetical protein
MQLCGKGQLQRIVVLGALLPDPSTFEKLLSAKSSFGVADAPTSGKARSWIPSMFA